MYTLAVRLVGDRHDAEDVVQDGYLRAYRALPRFRGDARFETWLYRIVANAAMTHLRRRGRFGEVLSEAQDAALPQIAAPPSEDSLGDAEVSRALAALPHGQRVVVVLKDVYGFSCQEIGDQIGISEGAVKVRLHRARRRLKELIYGPEGHGHEDVRQALPEYVEGGET